jgi:hypothetical protein
VILLAAAILAPCATELGKLRALPPAKRALIALGASAVPAVIALLIARTASDA